MLILEFHDRSIFVEIMPANIESLYKKYNITPGIKFESDWYGYFSKSNFLTFLLMKDYEQEGFREK